MIDMDFKKSLTAQGVRPVLYLAGDSMMQSYENDEKGHCGWGQMLAAEAAGESLCEAEHREGCPFPQERRYILPELILDNCAMAGRSLRTFASEGRLADIEKHMRPEDFLLVQFVHNDCNPDHPERFETLEEFADEMKRYSNVAKDKGAQPILATPIPLLNPESSLPKFRSYVETIREIACCEDIPCLDLTAKMEASLSYLGNRRSGLLYQPDGAHLTVDGAKHAAHIIAQMLRESEDERLSLLRSVFCKKNEQ